ncbi:hypothetical protein ACPPVW_18655 [Leifsonia sp. McL0607]|uniref:hypothetical protein n=1 Tax=Leifsonia sp. McL0607 TaxID=3415672 RepID=UPI003CFA969E
MTQETNTVNPAQLYNQTGDGRPVATIGWLVIVTLAAIGGALLLAATLGAGDAALTIGVCAVVGAALIVGAVLRAAVADRYRTRLRRLLAENHIEPVRIGVSLRPAATPVGAPSECMHECCRMARQAA